MFLNRSFTSCLMLHQCFFKHKQLLHLLRNYSWLSVINRKPVLVEKSEYKLIYDFPLIRIPVAIGRSGVKPLLFSIVSSPFIYFFFESVTPSLMTIGAASLHCLFTVGFSKLTENMVGKIYVNKEGEIKNVLFSSIDKFGRRIDRVHSPEELLNCEYFNKFSRHLGIIHIIVINTDLHYKVNLRSCKVPEQSLWNNLFGESHNVVKKNVFGRAEIKKIR